jgi:hypothetical protein
MVVVRARHVTKRVAFGELVGFLRTKPTHQLTPGPEISVAGRFSFYASSGNGLRRLGRSRKSFFFEVDDSRRWFQMILGAGDKAGGDVGQAVLIDTDFGTSAERSVDRRAA